MSSDLTANERKALKILDMEEWENSAQLYVGEKTIDNLLARGFMEHMPPLPSGTVRFKITDAGREAGRRPFPAKKRGKPRLKMLEPRLQALPPPLSSFKKRK